MKTQLVKGVEVHTGSGNVFADLGLADADKLKIKTGLVLEIRKAMRSLGMTQLEAAKRMGITQPKVSDMMRGDFSNLSERKLMDCLTRLGYDIEIKVRPRWVRCRNCSNFLVNLPFAERNSDWGNWKLRFSTIMATLDQPLFSSLRGSACGERGVSGI